jgi:predicted dehydrogenase
MRIAHLFRKSKVKFTSVCDIDEIKLKEIGDKYKIDDNLRFSDEKEFFAEKRADALWICTGDKHHYRQCMRALELGYDIMLEKPVSASVDECLEIERTAKEKNLRVVVCHVLRYADYYRKIKQLLRSGGLGKVVTINHQENIAYFHFAHSYVRGNWHREEDSAPVLLAKCCHDIDLISWFMEDEASEAESFGELSYFTAENAPEGAPERCIDGCPDQNCPYNAVKLYLTDPWYKAKFIKYMPRVLTRKNKSSREDIVRALKEGDYGKCVFKCDNDVCDHQSVLMKFSGGRTAVHTLSAFTDSFYRETHITCEKGEIYGRDNQAYLTVRLFGEKPKRVPIALFKLPGHIEGDINLVKRFVDLLLGDMSESEDLTFISATIPSHRTIAKAEASRLKQHEPTRA